jgi:hypothetical protein
MKRLSAIALSLLLLWVQVFVLALPAAAMPVECLCCECQQTDCCVAESSSGSLPLTATPVPSTQFNLHPFTVAASLVWLLPTGDSDLLSAAPASLFSTVRVPLFTRDCALLI